LPAWQIGEKVTRCVTSRVFSVGVYPRMFLRQQVMVAIQTRRMTDKMPVDVWTSV
jgi:hypothetical protein